MKRLGRRDSDSDSATWFDDLLAPFHDESSRILNLLLGHYKDIIHKFLHNRVGVRA